MGIELGFDPMTLPEPEEVTRYFQPSMRTKRPVADGFLHHSESSFGPELLLAAGGGVFFGLSGSSTSAAPRGGDELRVEPVPAGATAEDAAAERSADNLDILSFSKDDVDSSRVVRSTRNLSSVSF